MWTLRSFSSKILFERQISSSLTKLGMLSNLLPESDPNKLRAA
jgi:hypothetical protein